MVAGTRLVTSQTPNIRPRRYPLVGALLVTLGVAVLTGCGSTSGDPSAESAPSTGVSSPVAPSAPPSAPASTVPVPSSPEPGGVQPSRGVPTVAPTGPGEITVTGQVEQGVEGGCTILRTADQTYLLLGGDRSALRPGVRVTVRGKPSAGGTVTFCQQGTPLQVTHVQPG